MIKIYPSALDGEPIEVHELDEPIEIAAWLASVAPAFSMQQETHPISIVLNGKLIEPQYWPVTKMRPQDEVAITVEPKGVGLFVFLAVVAVVAVGAALYMAHNMKKGDKAKSQLKGDELDSSNLQTNSARWGEPIPEISGSPWTFPAMLNPMHKWYDTPRQTGNGGGTKRESTEFSEVLLCIGKGHFDVSASDVRIGDTPASLLGDSVNISFFGPDANISGVDAARWWHQSQEVGFTTFGGTGLTLGVASSVTPTWTGTFSISTPDKLVNAEAAPSSWQVGMFVSGLYVDADFYIGSGYVSSPLFDSLGVGAGDGVWIGGYGIMNSGLLVSSVTPASGGTAGNLASITGSAAPEVDYSGGAATFTLVVAGVPYVITLNSDYVTTSALVSAINSQISGSVMRASMSGNVVKLEQQGAINGLQVSLSGSYSRTLGAAPVIVQGALPAPAHAAKYHISSMWLPAAGQTVRVAAGLLGGSYRITAISGDRKSVTVEPEDNALWNGFPAGTTLTSGQVRLSSTNYEVGWNGPFRVAPVGETVDVIEVDIFFPQGLISYNDKGDPKNQTAGGVIQYRKVGGAWSSFSFTNTQQTPNQIAYTYQIPVSSGEYEVRVRANEIASDDSKINNKQQWTGLKGRLTTTKNTYPGMTLMSVKLQSGDKISGGIENLVSVRARRKLPRLDAPATLETTRHIAPFFYHMMKTVGYESFIDMDKLNALHSTWVSKGEVFDFAFAAETTLKRAAGDLLRAGFSEMVLKDGLISVVREDTQVGLPTRIFSSQEFTKPLEQTFKPKNPNDIDGVDVEYIDYESGKKTTAKYRIGGEAGNRAEKLTVVGVTSQAKALAHAARHRKRAEFQRIQYAAQTELQAMNVNYGDFIGLQDTIPEYGQSAFVTRIDGHKVFLSDRIAYTEPTLHIAVRKPDGTVQGGFTATQDISQKCFIFAAGVPQEIRELDENGEATVLYFGNSVDFYYKAIVTEVRANNDGTVDLKAVNYDSRIY